MMSNRHSSSIITTPVEELQDDAESISLEQLQLLVRLVDQSDIVELEVTHSGTRRTLVLRRSGLLISDATPAESCSPTQEATNYESGPRRYTITAPCVGFFQLWSKSKNKPLVVVGDTVKDGQHVAVIRSLGISNEVESPVTGRIVEILVQDGQPVEYGQPLMEIENC
jgi:biotin carboxyl carrier protein